jgi:hypothetical protein
MRRHTGIRVWTVACVCGHLEIVAHRLRPGNITDHHVADRAEVRPPEDRMGMSDDLITF